MLILFEIFVSQILYQNRGALLILFGVEVDSDILPARIDLFSI